jgi:hypothetical protein
MRCQLLAILTAGLMAAPGLGAQPGTPPKHDARVLRDALREVINTGADLFNRDGDHAGCYRVYQGGLLSIKPVLPLELQARIDDALKAAERAPRYSEKAFKLREALDAVRDWAGPAGKTDDGKATAVNGKSDKAAIKVDPNLGQLAGKVLYEGKPAPPGFVTLIGDGRKVSTSILPDGTYRFKTGLTPGEYRVVIERTPGAVIPKNLDIPERYRQAETSGLKINVTRGSQIVELNLAR